MEFRVARSDELGKIANLYHQVWHETQAPHQHQDIASFRDISFMQERIDAFYPNIIIALDEGNLVALVIAKEARLSQLFVANTVRGMGVGQRLLELGEAKLVAEGALRATLNCLVGNDGARRFYERNGWQVSETQSKTAQTHSGSVTIKAWEMEKQLDVFDHFT
ncbi:GNAT family N-acetyltransferase [Maritalea porphyrae]|jgi:GNAT superfamily N-acetyltransferase|uniref:GNAT family N-acetyltransferase n=1 Tax=Maritalea porphyrae TaxID=880732 RepID=UPI0022AEC02C|nr:GNAT family N-acetyltransferase [Maritalea porphyrae]MCZ4271886.1 GNAT family N-acetyltransferase [Maritalea porphyrae]